MSRATWLRLTKPHRNHAKLQLWPNPRELLPPRTDWHRLQTSRSHRVPGQRRRHADAPQRCRELVWPCAVTDQLRRNPRRRRRGPVTIALDHAEDAMHQIAKLPGKLGFGCPPQTPVGEVAIAGRADMAQQKIAQRVRPQLLRQRHGIDGVACRLANLTPLDGDIPVDKNARWQGQACGQQHGRPVDRMDRLMPLPTMCSREAAWVHHCKRLSSSLP